MMSNYNSLTPSQTLDVDPVSQHVVTNWTVGQTVTVHSLGAHTHDMPIGP